MGVSKRNAEGYPDPTACTALNNVIRKSKSNPHPTEAQEQAALFEWAEWNMNKYPELWFLHAIPNGGSRHDAEAANLKRQGVKPGVSDMFLPVARHGHHGMYIELKRISGYSISDAQTKWINGVREQGYYAVFAYGFEDARKYIEWYLGEKVVNRD